MRNNQKKRVTEILVLVLLVLSLCSCGVKGKPLPPLEAPFLSGHPQTQTNDQAKKK